MVHKFREHLPYLIQEWTTLARRVVATASVELLDTYAFAYYEHVRPDIPSGTQGWGAPGDFHLAQLYNFAPFSDDDTDAKKGPLDDYVGHSAAAAAAAVRR